MRKANKRILDAAIILNIMERCHVGRLGTVGADGWPMIKPLNFVFSDWRIYFHCALQGEKLDHLRRDERVCFEIDLPVAYVRGTTVQPCRAEYLYRSIIARGRARLVEDRAEKARALDLLMAKYQPDETFAPYSDDKLGMTGVVCIEIEDLTGKEELGKGALREKALAALRDGVALPLTLDYDD